MMETQDEYKQRLLREARERKAKRTNQAIPMGQVAELNAAATAKLNGELEESERRYWDRQAEMGGFGGMLNVVGPSGNSPGYEGGDAGGDVFVADNPISNGGE